MLVNPIKLLKLLYPNIQVRKRGAEEEPEEAPGDLARSWQEADQGAEHLSRSWQEEEQQEAEMMDGRGELTPHQIAQLMSIIADMDSVKGLRGADTEVDRGRSPPTDAELEEFISYMERGGARMQVRGSPEITHDPLLFSVAQGIF